MISQLHVPREYSFWVHFGMSTVVGCTMIAVGLFITWRVHATHRIIAQVESHLTNQASGIDELRSNQVEALRLLRQISK